MQISLRAKVRILLLTLLITLGVGSIVAFKYLANQDLDRRIRENAADTSSFITRYVQDSQTELQKKVRLIAQLPTTKSILEINRLGLGTTDQLQMQTLASNLDRYCTDLGVESIAFMDSRGRVLASSPRWPRYMPSLLDRRGVSEVFDGKPWQGLSADDGILHSVVISPIQLSNQGLYAAMIGLSRIGGEQAQNLKLKGTSEVVFMDGDHTLSASREFNSSFRADDSKLQWGQLGSRSFVGVYHTMPSTLPNQKLGFIAFEDFNEINSFNQSAGAAFILILVLITVTSLLFAERFTGTLVKPLDDVVKAAQEMREGKSPEPFEVGQRKDEVAALQTVFNDMVTAVEQNNKLLVGMIDTDPLTGLINHRSFHERLRAEIAKARKSGQPLSLLMADLVAFHDFNLRAGHAEGDKQLKAYASLIRGTCPGSTILARYSGDQFVALMPNHSVDEALKVADDIRRAAGQGTALVPTSIGIAVLDPMSPNEEALILSAELALSRAKQLGGDRTSVFENDLDSDTPGSSHLIQKYLADGSLATVQALAAAVDAKDQYTKGHSERVAYLARELASYLGDSPAFVELLYRAGTLHDVGKIGVPDAILSKPDRLTEEETSVMETHPVLGEVIVGKVPQLAPLLPGVRNHHERWDGKGYPDGLAGMDIPVLARYLAVADTFDAMTSDRPYRRALSVDVALAEIEKCAGTQFEARLARAFVAMVREQEGLDLGPATAKAH